ncbi:hypothetical protein AJ80_01505 [Polytolypa hystricis UAMH7299]|uniref:Uncharacterized protein n=1 Tax=Polytolypa hystricis (strain UAMH7299) TaxID=1447883 RepID=A0A2B7Z098_POLH7|nr:hypothetical protein AJ80_01505 [Polytolypa hystricis UAMH7299]
MPHYIRFLKSPKLESSGKTSGSHSISSLITITTDLGDDFLAEDVELLATVQTSSQKKNISVNKNFEWRAGNRELKISILLPRKVNVEKDTSSTTLRLGIFRAEKYDGAEILGQATTDEVIGGWSTWFRGTPLGVQAEKLIERVFHNEEEDLPALRIWEETGNSIALHIWDAALACVREFEHAYIQHPSALRTLHHLFHNRHASHLNAIELGTGCGIVGISLAQLLPSCSILLTDLEEVQDLLSHNLAAAKMANCSTATFRALNWEDELLPAAIARVKQDLIAVSDCTYNCDSLPVLVKTLGALVDVSPGAIVLVALKRRHESEDVFFDLMRDARFTVKENATRTFSSLGLEEKVEVEMYVFERDDL